MDGLHSQGQGGCAGRMSELTIGDHDELLFESAFLLSRNRPPQKTCGRMGGKWLVSGLYCLHASPHTV